MKSIIRAPFQLFQQKFPGFRRNAGNILKYGFSAPRYHERIWINPQEVNRYIPKREIKRITGGFHKEEASACVVDWNEIRETIPITEDFKIQYCFRHWGDGRSWEELGIYDFLSRSPNYVSFTREEIIERYETLDQAYREAEETGRLKTREEMGFTRKKETGGILIHIGRGGVPYFGRIGTHRLAIAKVLKLKEIPACIGVVDREAIRHLHKFRKRQPYRNRAN